MASELVDGDYLGSYRRFIVDFLDKVNPDDQLPIKTSGHDVSEDEMVGEIIHMTLQYLNQQLCPPSLQCYIVQLVIEEIKATCRKQPESCGYRQEEKTYAPLKLMQAVASKVNEICQRYLENSRLALLPPPPSTPMPLANAFAIRNNRRKMEDRHVILHDLNTIFNIKDDSIASYYAVFDGHAGYQAAVFCAAHLHQYLAESHYYPTDPERALRDAFLTADNIFVQKSTRQTLSSGTTAVCALILNRKLYVAWAGDSQAALAKREVVTQLVNPHRPDRNDERDRVEMMGGTVMHSGIWRVNGSLAVSRAIGDALYKPYVTGEPEIRCITLDGDEDFLIIGCDGLWDSVTENEAAALVYRDLYRNPHDYESASQRLVEFAKSQGSIDNITVIVVFLAAPSKIASRSSHYGKPLLADVQLDNMEPDNRFLSNANGQFDMNSAFAKQSATNNGSPDLMDDEDPYGGYTGKPSNGKLRENGGGSVTAGYDAEEDDEDLGPETDVDAVDDVSEPVTTLADVSRELFPEKQDPCEIYQSEERMEDETPTSPQATKTNQQALIPEADNVGDSEDSEDEWNYYRIDPNKEKESAGAAGFSPEPKPDNATQEENAPGAAASSPTENHDFLGDEKNDSDTSSEPDSERENRSIALIDNEISADAKFEPTEEKVDKEEPEKFEHEKEAEEDLHLEEPEAVAEKLYLEQPEKETEHLYLEEPQKEADHSYLEEPEKEAERSYLEEPETEPEKAHREESEKEAEKLYLEEHQDEKKDLEDDMDFQLNPNAAEFVPVSPTPIMRMDLDAPIAGSPLKQTPVMDDITIPSRREFENEVRNRPCEIEEKSSCTNGQLLDELDECAVQKQPLATPMFNLDESEVSSTKAEFGDESSFLTASEFHRTGVSNLDGSYNDSYGAFDDSSVDPMTKSFGPGDFMALGNPVDLNAVHDLPDDDLMTDENGPRDVAEDEEKMNLENIQATEASVESEKSSYNEDASVDPFSANTTANILESSSPVLSPRSPAEKMHFGSDFAEYRAHSPVSSVVDAEKIAKDDEKLADELEAASPSPEPLHYGTSDATSKLLDMDEGQVASPSPQPTYEETSDATPNLLDMNEPAVASPSPQPTYEPEIASPSPQPIYEPEIASPSPQPTYDETNVTSKLLEMDLEDRGSQDCGFEKCNEKFADHEINSQRNDEIADFMSSPVPRDDFAASPAPESLPVESPRVEDVDKLADKFDDLRADENSPTHSTAAPEVPVLLNPLDLNVENTQSPQDDVGVEDTQDYQYAKVPESPVDIISPLIQQEEQPKNPFESADFGSPMSFGDSRPKLQDFEEKLLNSEPAEPTIAATQPEIPDTQPQKAAAATQPEIAETQPEIAATQPEVAATQPEIEETHEIPMDTAEVTSGLKLSESLQEFTGLEEQLNPENSIKISNGLAEENLLDIPSEERKVDSVAGEISQPAELIEVAKEESKPESVEAEKKVEVPEPAKIEKNESATAAIAAVATAAAAGTAAATAAVATKATKTAKPTAAKTSGKSASATKAPANKSTPTSPTKPALSARTSSLTAAKKTASTTSAARPTKLDTAKAAAPSSTKPSSAAAAAAAAPAKSTVSAPKPAGRLSAASSRTKPATSTITKTSASADKKPTTNGDATKSSLTSSKLSSTASRAASKPLVKSATSRASPASTTTTATTARARTSTSSAAGASTLAKTQSKTATTGTVGTTTQRPKTAPTGGSAGGATTLAAKSRLTSSTKSPITEKQIKETANKQISSSRTSTTTTASKTSRTSVSSSTTTTTRRVAASKTTTSSSSSSATATQAIPPPIRKPAPITRPAGKTVANATTTAAAGAAPTTNGKTHVTKTTATNKTKVVVQNGVCTADQETKIVTSTTSNEDEDVPKKDLSPVEPPTDNQLIIAAD